MKLKGQKLSGANVDVCVIPRGNGEHIAFKCQAVLDMDEYDKLCPAPIVPVRLLAGGKRVQDVEDPIYKAKLESRNEKRIQYLILKSLEATEDLEWETVVMGDSDSWGNYEKELKESGFSSIEVMRIVNTIMSVNCLSEDKLKEARDYFLATELEKQAQLSIPNIEQ